MVKIKFYCASDDGTNIEVKSSPDYLIIETCSYDENLSIINLDKETAIKLSKELRKQIALID